MTDPHPAPEIPAPLTFRVLVVDDDPLLQKTLEKVLAAYGCSVSFLPDGSSIQEHLRSLSPDIVILDIILPGRDGFGVLRDIREISTVPVLILTGQDGDADRIAGLELGADDYMTKPFNTRELLARMKALLRRAKDTWQLGKKKEREEPEGILKTGSVSLDCWRQELKRRGKKKTLSTTEFLLVRTFMQHAGKTLSREELLSLSFGDDHLSTDRSIDVHINRLRKILAALGEDQPRIQTIWGKGYCWLAKG